MLGAAAADVDTGAERRVEVAAAASELLLLRAEELQQGAEDSAKEAREQAIQAAHAHARAVEELRQSHAEVVARMSARLEEEGRVLEEARSSGVRLQRELSEALAEAQVGLHCLLILAPLGA